MKMGVHIKILIELQAAEMHHFRGALSLGEALLNTECINTEYINSLYSLNAEEHVASLEV